MSDRLLKHDSNPYNALQPVTTPCACVTDLCTFVMALITSTTSYNSLQVCYDSTQLSWPLYAKYGLPMPSREKIFTRIVLKALSLKYFRCGTVRETMKWGSACVGRARINTSNGGDTEVQQ